MSKIIRILLSAGKGDWASLPSEICGAAAAHHPAQSHQKREIPRQEQPDDSLYNSMYLGKRSRDALSLPGIRTAGYRYLDYRVSGLPGFRLIEKLDTGWIPHYFVYFFG